MGQEFWISEDPCLQDAIHKLKPVISQRDQASQGSERESPAWCSMLVVATCYQDQPNGLIILHQCDRPRIWSEAELDLMQDLADQVGTAIAHATLFTDSQALATELRETNFKLLQKHRELEIARSQAEEARNQAEEASRLKSEFLANTSHELRTPLNGMIGFLKLIMDGMADDPEEQNEFIKEAHRAALHLLNIITDVLDIAKIEAGKLEIEMDAVKLSELLQDVKDLTDSQIRQKNLSFKIEKPPTEDEIILYGNYQRLLQVMLNLVGNAIKFTPEGGITVSVEIIKKKTIVQNQELPGMAKVRVADTGIGVSLDKQDKLFQSFSQVDGSRTRHYGGTGLGLAISQKLVETMGGVVNFYSMGEGLGSTVTFTVPLYQEPLMISP
jgi:signal transduction histidine kinase